MNAHRFHTPPRLARPTLGRVAAAALLLLALVLAGCQAAEEFGSEGSEGSPIPVGSETASWPGEVGPQPESSHYTLDASPDTTYTVSLSSLVNDAFFVVYMDSFGGAQLCAAVNPGATSISCNGTTTSAISSLKIRVLSYSEDGTDYLLIVSSP